MKSRSQIRENALQFLYLLSYQPDDKDKQREMFIEAQGLASEDLPFFDCLVEGVLTHEAELDKEIEPQLVDWRLSRLPILDRNILRMALFELNYLEEVPEAVSISEAVNLAKKYCDDKAGPYINAVLGKLARERG
ncbi:MAG: transcription antitermination factor NusB [Eubacteriales bacterium]|nr:transcription antitermination factor NusB [Eubacteriales bacterium]